MTEFLDSRAKFGDGRVEVVGDLTGVQIRYLIEEQQHQITHLLRSISELLEALVTSPDDQDYKDAVRENEVVLLRKRGQIKGYIETLKQIDPAYAQEHANELSSIINVHRLGDLNLPAVSASAPAGSGGGDAIEIYMQGQRQTQIEQRILATATAGEEQPEDANASDESTQPVQAPAPAAPAPAPAPAADGGLYL